MLSAPAPSLAAEPALDGATATPAKGSGNAASLVGAPATGRAEALKALAARPAVPPPPTETLEAPPAALLALVDASTGVSFRRRPWERLASTERASLGALGYDAARWDAARDGALSRLPDAAKRPFASLGAGERAAVRALGLDARAWDADVASRADILANQDILRAFERHLAKAGPLGDEAARDLIREARDWGLESASEKRALLSIVDLHGHRLSDGARRAIRDDVLRDTLLDRAAGGFSNEGWTGTVAPERRAGAARAADAGTAAKVVNDASGMSPTVVRDIVRVTSPDDVRAAIREAKSLGAKVSIAGRRHSEGAQTASAGSVHLDMLGMNRMEMLPDGKTVRVEAGATWAQVQSLLAEQGRAVKIMQTSNIFTVGGSLSVNCHGRQPGEAPFVSTVKSLRIMTADGEVKTASRTENPELFRSAIGGYGLFGVVLDVDLETTEDVPCRMEVEKIPRASFPARLAALRREPGVELAYGRIDPTLRDGEALLHVVRRDGAPGGSGGASRSGDVERAGPVATAVGKVAFAASKLGPDLLEARWWAEKKLKGGDAVGTRNGFMAPNVDLLRQYWWNEGAKADILHELFIPPERYAEFTEGLRAVQEKHGTTSLNCTMRDVAKDEETALPYAKGDRIAFVLYYNTSIDGAGRESQAALQKDLVDLATRLGGSFYLPYQRGYTSEQLKKAYPESDRFFAAKRAADPGELFSNAWYEQYGRPTR